MDLVSIKAFGCSTTVDRDFARILQRADAVLREQYADAMLALPAGAPQPTFGEWHGVRGVGGHRPGSSWHGKGKAVDLNYTTNPYVATRNLRSYGGEGAGRGLGVRRPAVEAYDRACLVRWGRPADVTGRKAGESTGAAWDRFRAVSVALEAYFAPYFRREAKLVERRPVVKYATAPAEAFEVMAERGELAVPLAAVPLQVLRDFEAVRIPTVVGAPSKAPGVTRNPARGIMDLPRHTVVAVCDLGGQLLRWGMIDFGDGASATRDAEEGENGDGMHADMGGRARPRA
ncbi:MAG: hypothetical protein JWM10_1926 [Myxococcaceae bacterium]|nr:hypothetical protein [Myxococcaceae bacterium]